MAVPSVRDDVERLLCVLETLGRPASVGDLAAIVRVSPARVRAMLANVVARGDVREVAAPGRRARLYASQTSVFAHDQQAKAAARIARWAESAGRGHETVARLWRLAGEQGRAQAFFEAAATHAEVRGDADVSLQHLAQAIGLEPDDRKRAELERRAAVQERRAGRAADAELRLRRAADRASDDDVRLPLLVNLARLRLFAGDASGALAILTPLTRSAAEGRPGVSLARSLQAFAAASCGQVADAERIDPRCAERGESDAVWALADARALRATGAPRIAVPLLAATLARPLDSDLEALLRLEYVRALTWSRALGDARASVEESYGWAIAVGERLAAATFAAEAAWLASAAADWSAARMWLERGGAGDVDRLGAVAQAAAIALALGGNDPAAARREGAGEHLDRVLERGVSDDVERLGSAVARAARAEGDAQSARRLLEACLRTIPSASCVPLLLAELAVLGGLRESRHVRALLRAVENGAETVLGAFATLVVSGDGSMLAELGWDITVPPAVLPSGAGKALSPRRSQVAALAAAGLTNAEIAGRLGISPDTVKHHMTEILRELGLRSRHQIAHTTDRMRFQR